MLGRQLPFQRTADAFGGMSDGAVQVRVDAFAPDRPAETQADRDGARGRGWTVPIGHVPDADADASKLARPPPEPEPESPLDVGAQRGGQVRREDSNSQVHGARLQVRSMAALAWIRVIRCRIAPPLLAAAGPCTPGIAQALISDQ